MKKEDQKREKEQNRYKSRRVSICRYRNTDSVLRKFGIYLSSLPYESLRMAYKRIS